MASATSCTTLSMSGSLLCTYSCIPLRTALSTFSRYEAGQASCPMSNAEPACLRHSRAAVPLLAALHNPQCFLEHSGLSTTEYSRYRQSSIRRLQPQQRCVALAMAACGVTSGGALPAAVQLLLELSMVCCAHIRRCLVLQAWLRPWECRVVKQPVLLLSHRLDVVSNCRKACKCSRLCSSCILACGQQIVNCFYRLRASG